MIATELDFNVLVLGDSHEDFARIESFITQGFPSVEIRLAESLNTAVFSSDAIDIIIVDLAIEDNWRELLENVKKRSGDIPIIVLTDIKLSFSSDLLAAGVADYLVKEELTPFQIHKSITYCLERKSYLSRIKASEEKYKMLFDQGPMPKWIYHRGTLKFLDVNFAAVEHYGYSREEFLEMTIEDIRPEEELKILHKSLREIEGSTKAVRGYYKHRKKNGQIIDVQLDATELEFQGERARLVVSLDITEKLKSESALAESERRFKYLVQESGDAILIMAADGVVKYVSPNHKTIVGYSPEELLGTNILRHIHREDIRYVIKLYRKVRNKKQIVSKPFRFKHSNGTYVWLESIASNATDDAIIDGFLINSRDVTARIENEQKVRDANERFEAVAKATSDAIYTYDFITEQIYITGSTYHIMFGHEIDNHVTDLAFFISLLHPDDIKRVLTFFSAAIETDKKTHFEIEYRMRRVDSSYADILDRFKIVWINGVPVKKIGALQDVSVRNYQDRILSLEKNIYELNADPNVSFNDVIDKLVENFEHLLPLSHCSINMITDTGTLTNLSAKSLDPEYVNIVEGTSLEKISVKYTKQLMSGNFIFLTDIESDPDCIEFLKMVVPFGYKSCWLTPVKKRSGKVVATFSTHFPIAKTPSDQDRILLQRVGNLIGLLLENKDALEETAQAKERYDIVAKATSDTVWDWKIQEDHVVWNRGIQGIFGYPREEIGNTSKWWFDRIHPEDSLRVSIRLYSFLEDKLEKWQDEYRFACADGTYKHVYDRGFLVKDINGRPIRMISAMQDVTKQKQEEQRLKLLETVVTQTKDSVVITEAEKTNNSVPKIVFVNPAFTQMTGFSPDEVVGKSPSIFMGRQSVAGEITKLSQALKFKKEFKFETINHKKNGEEYWVNFSMIPITNKDGEHSHWISIQRDITTEKRQEKEKEQLIQELTQNNKDLKQFSYITSHNLRAPLSNLIGLLDLIEDMPVENEELNEIINGFSKSTHLLNETINDLVKVVIIKDNPSIEKEEVTIKDVFENVFNQLSYMIGLHKPIIKIELKKMTLVNMNKAYLESILLNLLTNAIKYRSTNRQLKINISSKEIGSNTVLIFKDNGIGIDLVRNAEKIFGLYQRFHNYPDSKGLGLYLVKSQVETMGGTISVQSEVNKGTTFTLTFKNR